MKCSNCSHPISEGEKFCSKCGQKVKNESENNYCINCGSKLENDNQFCSNCGCSVNGEVKHNININQSSNFLSGQYDKIIVLGYGMLVLQFLFGIYFGIVSAIIGFYLITRPNNNTNGTDPNDLINNPSKNTFIHGLLLIILPFCVFCLLFILYSARILTLPW